MFDFDGNEYTLDEMLEANRDDEELCEWLRTAPVGSWYYGAFCSLQRVA